MCCRYTMAGFTQYARVSQMEGLPKEENGQRIFSGERQIEFLSRTLVGVSEERWNEILEVAKMFGNEKITLSEYAHSLKSMARIRILVGAVGTRKSRPVLTEMPLENSKSNPARPEILTGKALSTLEADKIVNILSGDYRLSKARANDMFWEAVWPRMGDEYQVELQHSPSLTP